MQVEVRNAARLVRCMSTDAKFTVPTMYDRLCTAKVLTMEWISGCKVRQGCARGAKEGQRQDQGWRRAADGVCSLRVFILG